MPHPQTRDSDGFTLIELLVVAVILVVLSTIAVAVYSNQRERADREATQTEVNNVGLVVGVAAGSGSAAGQHTGTGDATRWTGQFSGPQETIFIDGETAVYLNSASRAYCVSKSALDGTTFSFTNAATTVQEGKGVCVSATALGPDPNPPPSGSSSGPPTPTPTATVPPGAVDVGHRYDPMGVRPDEINGGGGLLFASDGRLMVAGTAASPGAPFYNLVGSYPAGSSIPSCCFAWRNVGPTAPVLAAQPDGKILVGASSDSATPAGLPRLIRLNADGVTVDDSFRFLNAGDWGGTSLLGVRAVAVQPDGKILVGGGFIRRADNAYLTLIRLLPDGTVDPGFQVWPYSGPSVFSIRVTSTAILVAGQHGLVRLKVADGTVDPGFHADFAGAVYKVGVQADGKILAGGHGDMTSDHQMFVRLNSDGSRDASFRAPAFPEATAYGSADPSTPTVLTSTVQPSGKIVVGGFFDVGAHHNLLRLNSDGSVDETFNAPAFNGDVYSVVQDPSGRLVVGGMFTDVGGDPAADYIVSLNP